MISSNIKTLSVCAILPSVIVSVGFGQTLFAPGALGASSNSNVGIGTSAPLGKLDVLGTLRLDNGTTMSNYFSTITSRYDSTHPFSLSVENNTGGSALEVLGVYSPMGGSSVNLVLGVNGVVGVGTTTPVYKLDVRDPTSAQIAAVETGSGNSNRIIIGASASEAYVQELYSTNAKPLTFKINDEKMRIDVSGNVGVGTTTPIYKLDVRDPTLAQIASVETGSGNNNRIIIGASASESYVQELYSTTAKPLTFKVNDEKMRIDVLGNVGIGTSNPTQKLSVNGTIRAKEVIVDTGWSDYVFEPNYRLKTLGETEADIKRQGHLSDIPSAQEVAEHGVNMGAMQAKLLAKIEELTLHAISQEKREERLEQKLAVYGARIERLESENASLKTSLRD